MHSLRFDTLNIAQSYKIRSIASGYLLLIYFGKQKATSIFIAIAGDCKQLCY
jgi:hypothetical protein